MGQKKSFTASTSEILRREAQTAPQEEKRTDRGRPKNRTTSTSQEGLRDGLTRMTFIVDQVKQDKLKYISFFERLSIRQILDEAIEDYINKYEAQAGPIKLN